MKRLFCILSLFSLLLISALPASSQHSDDISSISDGFWGSFSRSIVISSINNDGRTTEGGSGISFLAGYNLSPNIGFFGGIEGANMRPDMDNMFGLGQVDLGIQLMPLSESESIRPYFRAALTGMSTVERDLNYRGGGLALTAGAAIYVLPQLAFNLGYTHSIINIQEVNAGNGWQEADFNALTGRVQIGLAYHFGRRSHS